MIVACALLTLGVLVLSGVVCAGAKPYFVTMEDIESREELRDFDCVIVLGARVYSDGSLSSVLKDRAIVGIDAYKAGASDVLLFSGDHGQTSYDEVNALREFAESQGVARDRIFLDHAGFSTYESMARLAQVFGAKKVLIVTQEYHLYRAIYNARALGMEAYGLPCDLRRYRSQLRFEARELLARAKDFFYCHVVKPEPTYLGDPIDLKGSGAQTHDMP